MGVADKSTCALEGPVLDGMASGPLPLGLVRDSDDASCWRRKASNEGGGAWRDDVDEDAVKEDMASDGCQVPVS